MENDIPEETEETLAEKVGGFGQKVIGEIETFGGILTGDPITQADGEYNTEVGDVREELEDDIENDEALLTE